jgi:hypothetical protein
MDPSITIDLNRTKKEKKKRNAENMTRLVRAIPTFQSPFHRQSSPQVQYSCQPHWEIGSMLIVFVPLVDILTHICRTGSKGCPRVCCVFAHLEDNLLVRDDVQHILGHAVVDQSRHGMELGLSQCLVALSLDQISLAALDALDMTIQVAHLGNVSGLGRPRGNGADSWQDNEKVETLVCF